MTQPPPAELARLIEAQLHGTPTLADTAALESALRADPAARHVWRRAANLDSALRDWAARDDDAARAWLAADAAAPHPAPARAGRSSPLWRWSLGLGVAAALSVAMYQFGTRSVPQPLAPRTQVLSDHTVVELNGPSVIVSDYHAGARHVRLERGEAHFTVTKDPARPFTVTAGGVTVQAVGTAFNVRLSGSSVEVLVTEGQVRLLPATSPAAAGADRSSLTELSPPPERVLKARQRAVVAGPLPSTAPEIATLTLGEIERVLAWQHRLLDFTATPLREIVAEFNRRNPVRLIVDDPALAALRLTASIRSDNMDGFVRLLEANYGVAVEPRGGTEIVLRRK